MTELSLLTAPSMIPDAFLRASAERSESLTEGSGLHFCFICLKRGYWVSKLLALALSTLGQLIHTTCDWKSSKWLAGWAVAKPFNLNLCIAAAFNFKYITLISKDSSSVTIWWGFSETASACWKFNRNEIWPPWDINPAKMNQHINKWQEPEKIVSEKRHSEG